MVPFLTSRRASRSTRPRRRRCSSSSPPRSSPASCCIAAASATCRLALRFGVARRRPAASSAHCSRSRCRRHVLRLVFALFLARVARPTRPRRSRRGMTDAPVDPSLVDRLAATIQSRVLSGEIPTRHAPAPGDARVRVRRQPDAGARGAPQARVERARLLSSRIAAPSFAGRRAATSARRMWSAQSSRGSRPRARSRASWTASSIRSAWRSSSFAIRSKE